ncbi:MAG: hypothetical protein HYY24_12190 [Verrucomicrobia bacterium]|nr:hypothetical protein [Verrucomicrobiota bacterium]
MRLLEAILDANHRALAGDATAGVRPREHADALPLVVLTCFDPRMHPLMPEVIGIPEPEFIWLTNGGNIVTHPLSSTVRSLALACAVHGGKEIVIIGHTDCLFFQPARLVANSFLQSWKLDLGPAARQLDEFLSRHFDGTQNVRLAAKLVRESPLISNRVPVHGLMVDVESGRLERVVNGYEGVGLLSGKVGLGPPPVSSVSTPPSSPPLGTGALRRPSIGTDLPPIGSA